MPDRSALGAAAEELSCAVDRGRSLCRPFLSVLPVVGAAVSTLGAPFGSETVCATDAQAATPAKYLAGTDGWNPVS